MKIQTRLRAGNGLDGGIAGGSGGEEEGYD